MARQTHPLPLFRTHEPQGTWNRRFRAVPFHAEDSTVLRTLLTDPSIPRPQRSQGLLPTDLVLHRTLPEPPRSQASLLPPHGQTGEHSRRNTRPPLHTPIARMVDAHMFHEGDPHRGHDCPFWRTSVSSHGSIQGQVYAAPSGCMRGNPGNTEAVPRRFIW